MAVSFVTWDDDHPDHPIAGDLVWGTRSDTLFPWPAIGTATRTYQDESGEWQAEI
jgi:hypothetical protein